MIREIIFKKLKFLILECKCEINFEKTFQNFQGRKKKERFF